jgi:hypothetical protein
MNLSRRIAALLSGVVMFGSAAAGPAVAAVAAAQPAAAEHGAVSAKTNPSDGFCDASEDGDLKLGGDGHLYRCSHIVGLGWYWVPA